MRPNVLNIFNEAATSTDEFEKDNEDPITDPVSWIASAENMPNSWLDISKSLPAKGNNMIAIVLNKKRIANDIKINLLLDLINGPISAIAVAPHIDNPDANKIFSFKSILNMFPRAKDNTKENIIKNKIHHA